MERSTDEEGRPLAARRLLENEKLYRRLNRKVEELERSIAASEAGGSAHGDPPGFFCECSDVRCEERLPLTHEDYDRAHRSADLFTLKPGHEVPAVETVVERADGWLVVRKTAPAGAPEVRG